MTVAADQTRNETHTAYVRFDRHRFNALVSAVAEWDLIQATRKKVQNPISRFAKQTGLAPAWGLNVLAALNGPEQEQEAKIVKLWRGHPLAPWQKNVPGLGEHSCAVAVAYLGGDPYVAYPARLNAKGAVVFDDPYVRRVSQLWSYCGLNPERKRVTEMSQADLLAMGKPLLKARLRLIAESMMKLRCGECTAAERARREKPDVAAAWAPPPADCTCVERGFRYRVLFDQARARYDDAVHSRPCRGRDTCGAEPGEPLRDGHKRAISLNIVAKTLLAEMYDEAKRLHQAGEW